MSYECGKFTETGSGGVSPSAAASQNLSTTAPNRGSMVASSAQGKVGDNIMESGENINGNAEVGTLENPSATGENPDIPDMTPAAQANHTKHLRPGKSYPGMTMEEYVRKSGELARSRVGGDGGTT